MKHLSALVFAAVLSASCHEGVAATTTANPILFVTQMPIPGDFATIGSVFGNHRADVAFVGRGGDLYIRYPDGVLRNLTAEAGFGEPGVYQGERSIAVRDPVVHWTGEKAMFAMVVGAPKEIYDRPTQRWQLYEVTGLARGATARIEKVPNQPAAYNNIEPAYASNGEIIFVSDRPRDGAPHLYPQLDEYETRVINSGLWKLSPLTGALILLQHAPSGSFTPTIDSFGRVVFTRWDHLQRDQQNDATNPTTFNYSGEHAGSVATTDRSEVFPVPRYATAGSQYLGHTFNQMFPWQINQDGTEEETLNHLGRHEMLKYFTRSMSGDPALRNFEGVVRTNTKPISFVLQMREDPTLPGRFVAIDAREFQDHASGQLIRFYAPPSRNAADIEFEYLTSRETWCCHDADHPDNTGHYRNPVVLSNGDIVVSHTDYKGTAVNLGSHANPRTPFDFRLKRLAPSGQYLAPVANLTAGIHRSVSYYDPDYLVSYSGSFWELQAVEVMSRPRPPDTGFELETPEFQAFSAEGVNAQAFRDYLRERNLGVMVVRDATARDAADQQQPFNLRVPGGRQTTGAGGPVHDISHMQFFQGDAIRGGGGAYGRRILAQHLHEPAAVEHNRAPAANAPLASRPIHADGSVALFVPARRALSWQSLSPAGAPVVQERFWITLQPGEVRACDGCHGINKAGQAGQTPSQQVSLAFRELLRRWKTEDADVLFSNGFE